MKKADTAVTTDQCCEQAQLRFCLSGDGEVLTTGSIIGVLEVS